MEGGVPYSEQITSSLSERSPPSLEVIEIGSSTEEPDGNEVWEIVSESNLSDSDVIIVSVSEASISKGQEGIRGGASVNSTLRGGRYLPLQCVIYCDILSLWTSEI